MEKHRHEVSKVREILINTLHEARFFSSIISSKAGELVQELAEKQKDKADNIYYASGMLAARLGFTDIEINPGVTAKQVRYDSGVYKKFDKSRYLLKSFVYDKKVEIDFHGQSHMTILALSVFDMVPFVLLQNAIKYSPPGYSVDVYFKEDSPSSLKVKVSSYGPLVEDCELDKLCERGFRASSSVNSEGEGLGLYLARRVCDLHNISLNVTRGDFLHHEIGGQKFQRFIVILGFEKE